MSVDVLLLVIGSYLGLGLVAVLLLEMITGRVSRNLKTASADTQALTGESSKMATVVTVLALWLLWPVAIYGAITSRKENDDGSKK